MKPIQAIMVLGLLCCAAVAAISISSRRENRHSFDTGGAIRTLPTSPTSCMRDNNLPC